MATDCCCSCVLSIAAAGGGDGDSRRWRRHWHWTIRFSKNPLRRRRLLLLLIVVIVMCATCFGPVRSNPAKAMLSAVALHLGGLVAPHILYAEPKKRAAQNWIWSVGTHMTYLLRSLSLVSNSIDSVHRRQSAVIHFARRAFLCVAARQYPSTLYAWHFDSFHSSLTESLSLSTFTITIVDIVQVLDETIELMNDGIEHLAECRTGANEIDRSPVHCEESSLRDIRMVSRRRRV